MDLFQSFNFTLLESSLVDGFNVLCQPSFVLAMFVGLLMLLFALNKSTNPYVRFISEFLFTVFLAVLVMLAIMYSSYRVAVLLIMSMLCVVFVACVERLILAIRTRSIAPFVESSDLFAVFVVTNHRYVFPMYASKNLLVVVTTAAGVLCNGVSYRGSVAMTDRCEIVGHCSKRVFLLDRVEYGYDYTVFVYVDSTVVENTPRVTPVKFEADV